MAQILDGKKLAAEILRELAENIKHAGITPTLIMVLCGNNPESLLYTKIKKKRSKEIGISSALYAFPKNITEQELIHHIKKLQKNVDGIMIQLPLPEHLCKEKVLNALDPAKDIDGLTSWSLGNIMMGNTTRENTMKESSTEEPIPIPLHVPATAKGIVRLLDAYAVQISGKEVAILNHSTLIGKPLAMLFLQRNATVTICHEYTTNLAHHLKRADILISAIGKPRFITSDLVKEGAAVIDVGIKKKENKIIGDVDFENVQKKASFITPVPGGVGPMTVAMLLENVVHAALAKRIHEATTPSKLNPTTLC